MPDQTYELQGVRIFECAKEGPKLMTDRDAIDVIGAARSDGSSLVVIPVQRLSDDFLRLSTRIAGNFIQKFVTYGVRLALVGDISQQSSESRALRDFVYECNRGSQVWFVANLEELDRKLK
jgi:Domain of unknown function (DUF4180)